MIDSAGTSGLHEGEPATTQECRLIVQEEAMNFSVGLVLYEAADFEEFDLIIGMDSKNIRDLKTLEEGKGRESKIKLMTDYCLNLKTNGVPDYYGVLKVLSE